MERRAAKEEREVGKETASAARKKMEEEDAAWAAAGDGVKSKADKKRDELESNRDSAAASKAEAKRLALLEENEMVRYRGVPLSLRFSWFALNSITSLNFIVECVLAPSTHCSKHEFVCDKLITSLQTLTYVHNPHKELASDSN